MTAAGSVTCVVEPGDLVLFDRRCAPMGPLGASICIGAKAFTMTPWDHVGVVVQREDGELCVLDANFSGTACYPLVDRLKKSKSNQIAIRKLYCTRTAAMKQLIRDYTTAITSVKYNGDMQQMMQAAFAQVEKSHLSRSKAAKAEADLLRFLWDAPGVSPVLVPGYFLPRHHKEASDAYYATVKQGQAAAAAALPDNGFTQLPDPSSRMYCSQLVADLYQRLGLLPHTPAAPFFIPADFSSSYSSSKLALKPGAVLGKDMVISLANAEVVQENGRIRITQPIAKKQSITLSPGDIYPVPVGCAVRVTTGDCEIMASHADHRDPVAQKQLPLRRLGVFPRQQDLVLERDVHWAPSTAKKDGFHLLAPRKQPNRQQETHFLVRAVDNATIQFSLDAQSPRPQLQPEAGAALIGLVTTAAFLVSNAGKSSALHYTDLLASAGHASPYMLMQDGLVDNIGQFVRVRKYNAGDVILRAGDTEHGLMALLSGEVSVNSPSGIVLPVAAKSTCFNAEALVDGESLSELQAATDVEVLELTRLGVCVLGFMSSIGVWGQKRDRNVSLQDLTTNLEQHGAQKHLTAALRLSLETLPSVRNSGTISTTALGMLELLTSTGSPISELLATGAIIVRPPSDLEQESPQAAMLSHTINSIRHSIERKAVVARHSTLRRHETPSPPKPIATSAATLPPTATQLLLQSSPFSFLHRPLGPSSDSSDQGSSGARHFPLAATVAGATAIAILTATTRRRFFNIFARYTARR